MTTMRNKGGLLVGIIGFAIVAFLAGDVIVSGRNIFGDGQNEIVIVNGDFFFQAEDGIRDHSR